MQQADAKIQTNPFTKDRLKQHLLEGKYSAEALFQLYVVQARSFVFEKRPHGPVEEMGFRSAIASSIAVNLNDVVIVGSAQTGFSTKTTELLAFDETFTTTKIRAHKSDVDVAIVSGAYFDKLHREMFKFTNGFERQWVTNVYYPTVEKLSHFPVLRADSNFYQYLARGWFRPDLVPSDFIFGYKKIVDEWKNRLDRKVSIGIYREWGVLKDYQIKTFTTLKDSALKGYL